ncbi:MAG: hypothetical protein H6607_12570 [Flavobacteriales bacterium]|nr:hypothetical protein [Flavobacteriales bacterium]
MKKLIKKFGFLGALVFCSSKIFCQTTDTISIYFEFGKNEINSKQLKKINSIPLKTYINNVDSVYFIGMADSVGSIKDNLALGEKRAREVYKNCKSFFPTDPKITVLSRGEVVLKSTQLSRRVDIILFSNSHEEIMVEIPPKPDSLCYYRADSLYHRSLIKPIIYRKKPYVLIETYSGPHFNKRAYFYASYDTALDSAILHPLKWRVSKAYEKTSTQTDYYTQIPKEDFENYGIITPGKKPCQNCGYELQNYAVEYENETAECLQTDWFLMQHAEAKTLRFDKSVAIVRVRKTYVNLNQEYFDGTTGELIEWKSLPNQAKNSDRKRKPRRETKSQFFYTTVAMYSNSTINGITRMMQCCPSYFEPSESTMECKGINCGGAETFPIQLKAGKFFQDSINPNYLGLVLHTSYFNYFQSEFFVGLSSPGKAMFSLTNRYILKNVSIMSGGSNSWTNLQSLNPTKLKAWCDFYAGYAYNYLFLKGENALFNGFLHLGFTGSNRPYWNVNSPYIELGIGHNFHQPNTNPFFFQANVGFRFMLYI